MAPLAPETKPVNLGVLVLEIACISAVKTDRTVARSMGSPLI
jgi:hypothetical protein